MVTDPFDTDYKNRVLAEKRHFEKLENFSRLPDIVGWWSERYLRPRIQEIFGYSGGNSFYLNPILSASQSNEKVLVASLGSGDGEVENALAKVLLDRGVSNVKIVGFELSKELVEKASMRAAALGVADVAAFHNSDINSSFGSSQFDLIIANQVLHHILNLEDVFDSCHKALKDDGFIMTRDMIGMNGHQAWPEARGVVDDIWSDMPDRYKFNTRSKKFSETFPNTDFSTSGFEGIRSQDIMRLINERFGYSHFYAFGGIVERFINRAYGPNYSTAKVDDREFVKRLQDINDDLIDSHEITPTQIVAYFTKKPLQGKHWKHRSPARAVRI